MDYDPDNLVATSFGLMEPASDLAVEKSEIDLIHVPGVVFNDEGYRIGYGAGYYDRYLEKHPELVHIALAFEFQVFPEVPFEAHDILPQMIVTETRMIRPEGK